MDELLFAVDEDDSLYNEIIKNNLNDRRIVINQEITDDLLESVCLMIMKWNTEDKNLPICNRKKFISISIAMVAIALWGV